MPSSYQADNKTRPTRKSVKKYLQGVEPAGRKEDATVLLKLMSEVTGEQARMWGSSIIGFGTFGQFLARRWVRRGHVIVAQSRTDYSAVAEEIGVQYVKTAAELLDMQLDVVVLAVSVLSLLLLFVLLLLLLLPLLVILLILLLLILLAISILLLVVLVILKLV